MRTMTRFLFWCCLTLSVEAHAEDCLTRVWRGNIGVVPITMEFEANDWNGTLAGQYYYRANLNDLLLVRDDANESRWKEVDPKGKVTATLSITCKGDALTGEWISADGSRTLNLSANAAPPDTYFKARSAEIKPIAAARKSIGKFHYEQLMVKGIDSVRTIRLQGNTPGIAKINEALRKTFLDDLDATIRCRSRGRVQQGEDHSYEYSTFANVIDWNKAYVVIEFGQTYFCGDGAHTYSNWTATTYDVTSGETEPIATWLDDDEPTGIPRDSRLGKVLMRLYRGSSSAEEDECRDVVTFSGANAWPTSTGLVFRAEAPYVSRMCVENITIPYAKVGRFLTARGKENSRHFQKR